MFTSVLFPVMVVFSPLCSQLGLSDIDIVTEKTPSQFLQDMIDANPTVDTHSVVDLGMQETRAAFLSALTGLAVVSDSLCDSPSMYF
jgi:hypothetical protein